jgi:hypothetical protein
VPEVTEFLPGKKCVGRRELLLSGRTAYQINDRSGLNRTAANGAGSKQKVERRWAMADAETQSGFLRA